jgi:paraquat-inducible protein A
MIDAPVTAAARGLLSCHVCGLLSRGGHGGRTLHCPRCSAPLHVRKPNSVARSWAFLIAAYILYIPANVLPIMKTSSLFGAQADTIMSGIIYLWHSGSWDLALVVFTASIMVPLLKLIALTLLLISVQRRSTWQPMQRAKLYRVVELVGRWSMLDIYVVAILTALVQIGALATINAGPGALAFGAVVVLTMFSAMEFDPRLIWDPLGACQDLGNRRENSAERGQILSILQVNSQSIDQESGKIWTAQTDLPQIPPKPGRLLKKERTGHE